MDEQQPLLPRDGSNATGDASKDDTSRQYSIHRFLPHIHVTEPRYRFLPLIGCLLVLVNEGEYFFKQIAYFRAIEALYCIEYFNDIDPEVAKLGRKIPESMCKLDAIQKKVATANGIVILVRMTSAFIGTIPLGYLSDKSGRRLPLIMHKVGTIIYTLCVFVSYMGYPVVPIWVSFLGGLGGLIGANFDLNLAVMLAAYTDAMTSSTQRSTYFFITTSMQYVGQVSFPLAAGRAINLDGQGGTSEVSLSISLGMAVAGLVISLFFRPETMKKERSIGQASADAVIDSSSIDQTETKTAGVLGSLAHKLRSFWTDFKRNVQGIGMTNIWCLAFSMFLITTAIKSVDWLGLIQYPVIKFGWKYNQSAYAMAIQAIVYILLYFLLLPACNRLGIRLGYTKSSTSLIIMLLCLVFLEVGSVLLGLSATAVQFIGATCVYTLGAGLPAVVQTYIANLVDKTGLGKVLAIVSLFQVAGKIASSGTGPVIIAAGIDSGNEQLKGALFFFAALVLLFAAASLGIVVFRAGIAKAEPDGTTENDDQNLEQGT
ncbi:MFS general substrate transporter [Lecanosticta acicola]|uniref:MFS general substrate transporter n=1 Tax=Lecanosticta acicola TaxID=111012 RepID=A0AAI9ECL7_9PEZI|nr:MFS general substrate transporter [Lecanosticta acicola]